MAHWEDDEWDESAVKKPLPRKVEEEEDESEEERVDEEEKTTSAPSKSDSAKPVAKSAAKAEKPEKSEAKVAGKKEDKITEKKAEPKSDMVDAAKPKAVSGVVYKNSLEELEISLQSHVDTLVKLVVPKLQGATAKRAPAKFWGDVLRAMQLKLTLPDCEQLHKVVKEMHAKAKKAEVEAEKKRLEEEEAKRKQTSLPQHEIADEDFYKDLM